MNNIFMNNILCNIPPNQTYKLETKIVDIDISKKFYVHPLTKLKKIKQFF